MLVLAGANAVGVVLFGALYVTAGLDLLSQAAFLGCLAALLALVTALWVRTEARHEALGFTRRFGRAAFGLAVVVLVTPPLVLMPVFWLDSILPPEAGAAWKPVPRCATSARDACSTATTSGRSPCEYAALRLYFWL